MTTEPFSITGPIKENFVLTFAQHNLLAKEVMACVFQQRMDLVDHIRLCQLSSFSHLLKCLSWSFITFPLCHHNHQSRLRSSHPPLLPLLSSCQPCAMRPRPGDLLAFDVSIVAP